MNLKNQRQKLKKKAIPWIFKLKNLNKQQFNCPVCNYTGAFKDVNPPTGYRKHAQCPQCRALERHRIHYVVVKQLLESMDTSNLSMLHFAPEAFFRDLFATKFEKYETADLYMPNVDYQVDLQNLPFADRSYDFIFASHVLEHVSDDLKAISEIRRILKPHGIAVLPIPLVAETTIEYPEPNPYEEYHVRAPGLDYFDRYELYFNKVERISSDLLPQKHQLYVYEDRSQWPTKECPLRPAMYQEKYLDIVPVCYA
ncbi:Methyltransferase type 11 [Hyella patelloides LEGE 07179]|uniref:Methyltransferase type 11 n=1 Tax=Hyella patelloides LEGE 07179 TaxID=945734 RepID=A0A563VP32_9CYAN|nr:class I SAM-dependent methyltransferase [Hyella patelloides]VEP13228.1 Methyltransferase type 11 [Hyella patelloides LEGE 07179]